ncbi:MAG: outer membrane protein [Methyloligellaceae bacterium]
MSNEGLSYATAAFVVAAGSVFFSQNVLAGGDIIPPRDYDEPQRVQTWTPKRTWSGFYVGGGLGIQQFKSDVSVDSKNKLKNTKTTGGNCTTTTSYNWCGPSTTTTTCTDCVTTEDYSSFDFAQTESFDSEWNVFGTVMIGLDRQLSNRVVGGIFANVDFGSSETDFAFSSPGGSTSFSGKFKSDYSATIGARLGYLLNEKTLAYGLIGYTRTSLKGSLDANISAPGLDDLSLSKKFSENVGGVTIGVGAERQISHNWSARVEYRYTWLGDLEAKLNGELGDAGDFLASCNVPEWTKDLDSKNSINFDPNLHSVRAVVTYKFNQ